MNLNVIILAAGEGKRMHSSLPKVLHQLAGKPLLRYVIDAAKLLNPENIYVVCGHQGECLQNQLHNLSVNWIEQTQQLGTAHAVQQVLSYLKSNERVLILYGDVPLISVETLKNFLQNTPEDSIGWLTGVLQNPDGFGRIIRDHDGKPVSIIEHKDASCDQLKIKEVNSGICIFPVDFLQKYLPKLSNQNLQLEYYLTDLFEKAVQNNFTVSTEQVVDEYEILGVNDKLQLAKLEHIFRKKSAEKFMKQGLHIVDPNRFDVRGDFKFGRDVFVDFNVLISGNVIVGNNVKIGSNVSLHNVVVGDDAIIHANCVIEDSNIGNECQIGPFARLRPETKLLDKVKIGNFVEIKKSCIGNGSKISHLSYIGDTVMGSNVNIGAGTITCNYDGVNKHKTTIEDNVFIGSNTQLIAPVKIENNATIGAGSTISHNAPAGKLTLSRSKQVTIENWKRKKNEED